MKSANAELKSERKITVKSGLLVFLVIFAGCNYQVKKDLGGATANGGGNTGSGAGPGPGKVQASISFENVSTQVLKPECSKCHSEFATYAGVMDDVTPGQSAASPLFARLKNNGGDMPARGKPMISDEAAALIRDWIDAGAPEKVAVITLKPVEPAPEVPPVAPPVTAPAPPVAPPIAPPAQSAVAPTFTDLEAKVFSQKCTMCHSDARKAAGFSLENYEGLAGNARLIVPGDSSKSGIYVSVILAPPATEPYMPPKRAVAAGFAKVLTEDESAALKAWIDAGALRS